MTAVREVFEKTGHRVRLLPPPLPEGYPHSAAPSAGDPRAALDAARGISLKALPSVERRSRALGDVAVTYDRVGRRSDCVRTLLAAERCAPQETHACPATKSLISSLLVSGPTSTELRGLAERSGVLAEEEDRPGSGAGRWAL
ncbi:hypothetical protein AB0D66_21845 [Streptomyces sp. NPDC048270]|uniref:hypothetical protein n=1 Tax=Streptomyces sp. NPDC048270 TaxID=3154615 RepID=UPI0033EFA38A